MQKAIAQQRTWRSKLLWLLAEMFVIFFGVYTAFLLDNHQAYRKDKEREQQFLIAMSEQLTQYAWTNERMLPMIDSLCTEFIDAYDKGDMPRPRWLRISSGSRTSVWEAAIQSGVLDVVDVDLLMKIQDYYSGRSTLMDNFITFRRLLEQSILPNANKGLSEFYDLKTKELKDKYIWYLESMVGIRDVANQVGQSTNSLLVELQEHLKR
jgi:hypothetical protein